MIGLMSDSHDDLSGIKQAVSFFNEKEVRMVLHAGDIISPFTVKELRALKCPLFAVYGNNDGERHSLYERFSGMGAEIKEFLELSIGDLRLCVYHGTHEAIVHALVESGLYGLVVRGHTHKQGIEKRGETLVVNPGEVCGYLTGKKTVALFDPEKMVAEICEL